jgi:hypothetical protein
MSTISQRATLLTAFVTRLAAITVANGYHTDAGLALYVGETPALGPDDPTEAIALVLDDDQPATAGAGLLIELPVMVHAVVRADREDVWLRVERIIADIKAAIETDDDRRLGGALTGPMTRGPVRAVPREDGSLALGASVEYRLPFKEAWGG